MDKKRLEIKVGLFVFIGLVLLAALIIQFSKGASLFQSTYELRLHAANAGGLKAKASVLLAGYEVGSVSDIKLADDTRSVIIILKIHKQFSIYHDARFAIEQSGFLGDQYVSVIPTKNEEPYLADKADVNCQEPFNLQEVARSAAGFIQRIDETAKKLDASVTDLRRVVLNEQVLTNFSIALDNVRSISDQARDTVNGLDTLIASNSVRISDATSNFVTFSQQLNQLSGTANGLLATNGTDISTAVKNIETSTEVLKSLVQDIQSGKGLAGAVLQNQQLAANVQTIAANLAVTSSNLNRRGLWGILWTHPDSSADTNAAARSPRGAKN